MNWACSPINGSKSEFSLDRVLIFLALDAEEITSRVALFTHSVKRFKSDAVKWLNG